MGFTLKVLASYVEPVNSFWGKKITISNTINTKLKNIIIYKYQ